MYRTQATVHFDVGHYPGLTAEDGNASPYLQDVLDKTTNALQQRFLARRELRFLAPDYRIDYQLEQSGVVQVIGTGATAREAQFLANTATEELVRQLRATRGRAVLRVLMGSEIVIAMRGNVVTSPFDYLLRDIILHEAFPLDPPVEPVVTPLHVEDVSREEQRDLTRALEVRYDLWTFEINQRNAALDTACNTSNTVTTGEREAVLWQCALQNTQVKQELDSRNLAIERRQTIDTALKYMHTRYQMDFTPDDTSGMAYRLGAPLPVEPVPRNIALFLTLAVLAGVIFGGFGVAIDRSAGVMPKLRELWNYRELIRNMVMRDLRARYKGSALGYLWTQLAPLLMMLVFLFVFTQILESNIALFPVFLIVALLPWNFCAEAISGGARSIIDNAHLIQKVFFPREVLPLVSVLSSLLNYLLSLPMMFLVMAITQLLVLGYLNVAWTVAYLPILVLIQTLFLVGVCFFISSLAVFFRDTVHLIGIVLQFWFFLTPVFYSLDIIGQSLARTVRWLNPMASLVDFYRDILYGNAVGVGMIPTPGLPALDSLLRVLVTTLIVLALGYWFFQRYSGQFGEEL
jgi:lipopolysaccharide transport system permease protein